MIKQFINAEIVVIFDRWVRTCSYLLINSTEMMLHLPLQF